MPTQWIDKHRNTHTIPKLTARRLRLIEQHIGKRIELEGVDAVSAIGALFVLERDQNPSVQNEDDFEDLLEGCLEDACTALGQEIVNFTRIKRGLAPLTLTDKTTAELQEIIQRHNAEMNAVENSTNNSVNLRVS